MISRTWGEFIALPLAERQAEVKAWLEAGIEATTWAEHNYLNGDYVKTDSRYNYEHGE